MSSVGTVFDVNIFSHAASVHHPSNSYPLLTGVGIVGRIVVSFLVIGSTVFPPFVSNVIVTSFLITFLHST